jgi:hypothetical protein
MEKDNNCIICNGKYSLSVVANNPTNEYVCKHHIEEIIKQLQDKQKRENDR